MRKINIAPGGRFLNQLDINNKHFVIVLGNKLKKELFGDKPALGQDVKIKTVNFNVVGVMQAGNKNIYNFYEDKAIIPYSAYISLWGDENVMYFIAHPDIRIDLKQTEQAMRSYFAHKLHFDKTDKVALRVFNTTKIYKFLKWFFIGVQLFLGICGALTLAVGCLGVANIMFLIVTERTREIGVKMAVGASTWHIILQIMLEALIIVGLGGAIGFLVAYAVTVILQHAPLPQWIGTPTISNLSVIVTISVLSLLGLISGYFPARRAASMDPVDALGFK
jgi:putative ABC transport system permease protein